MASLSHASKRGIFTCREKTKLASKTCVTASPDVQNSSRQLQPTTNMHAQPLSTPWSRSKLSLPKLKASLVACFRHLLAENFFPRFRKLRRSQKTSVANQNGQQPTKYFSAQRKLPRTVENFENSLAPEDILIAQHLQLRCSHFHSVPLWEGRNILCIVPSGFASVSHWQWLAACFGAASWRPGPCSRATFVAQRALVSSFLGSSLQVPGAGGFDCC